MIKTLVSLGFKQRDAEVYVFLAEIGPQERNAIADALKLSKAAALSKPKKPAI